MHMLESFATGSEIEMVLTLKVLCSMIEEQDANITAVICINHTCTSVDAVLAG